MAYRLSSFANSRFAQSIALSTAITVGFTISAFKDELKDAFKDITSTEVKPEITTTETNIEKLPPPNERPADFNNMIAHHEAAHTVVMIAFNRPYLTLKSVTIDSKNEWGLTRWNDSKYDSHKHDFLAMLASLYAAHIAEKDLLGVISTGTTKDIHNATEIAETMSNLGMGTLPPMDYKYLADNNALPPLTKERYGWDLHNILLNAQIAARSAVKTHENAIRFLAAKLLEDPDHTLSGDEVKKLLHFDEKRGLPLLTLSGELQLTGDKKPIYITDPIHRFYPFEKPTPAPTQTPLSELFKDIPLNELFKSPLSNLFNFKPKTPKDAPKAEPKAEPKKAPKPIPPKDKGYYKTRFEPNCPNSTGNATLDDITQTSARTCQTTVRYEI